MLDILGKAEASGEDIRIYFYPEHQRESLQKWLGDGFSYAHQQGNSLGRRMTNAFKDVFSKGVTDALLIGTDFPDLPVGLFHFGFQELERKDAVIGPTFDGGYYLIGFTNTSFTEDIFLNTMPWGTPTVFERTMQVFAEKSYKVHILPAWRDIDTCEDLDIFFNEKNGPSFFSLKSVRFLIETGFSHVQFKKDKRDGI